MNPLTTKHLVSSFSGKRRDEMFWDEFYEPASVHWLALYLSFFPSLPFFFTSPSWRKVGAMYIYKMVATNKLRTGERYRCILWNFKFDTHDDIDKSYTSYQFHLKHVRITIWSTILYDYHGEERGEGKDEGIFLNWIFNEIHDFSTKAALFVKDFC